MDRRVFWSVMALLVALGLWWHGRSDGALRGPDLGDRPAATPAPPEVAGAPEELPSPLGMAPTRSNPGQESGAAVAGGSRAEDSEEENEAEEERRDHFTGRLLRLGVPVPGARVTLRKSGQTELHWVTDGGGRFMVPRADRRGMRGMTIESGDLSLRVPVARMRFQEDSEAVYSIGNGTVTVRVWAQGGVPAEGTVVALAVSKTKDRARYSQRKESGADGRAVFHGIPAGPVEVSALCQAPNKAAGQLQEEGGQITIDVGPSPDAANLRVQVHLADGSPSSTRYRMNVEGLGSLAGKRHSVDCTFLPSGLYRTDIPPGEYELTVDPPLPGTPRKVLLTQGMGTVELVAGGGVVRGMLVGRKPSWPDAETGLGSEYGDSPREAWLLDEATGERKGVARIRDSGRFEITSVAPGRYVLTGNENRIDPALTRVPVQILDARDVIEVELGIDE